MQLQDKDLQDRPAQPMPAQVMQAGFRLLQQQLSAQLMHHSSSRTGSNREDRSSLTGKRKEWVADVAASAAAALCSRRCLVSTSNHTSSLAGCADDTLFSLRTAGSRLPLNRAAIPPIQACTTPLPVRGIVPYYGSQVACLIPCRNRAPAGPCPRICHPVADMLNA